MLPLPESGTAIHVARGVKLPRFDDWASTESLQLRVLTAAWLSLSLCMIPLLRLQASGHVAIQRSLRSESAPLAAWACADPFLAVLYVHSESTKPLRNGSTVWADVNRRLCVSVCVCVSVCE